jgi:hypothetical protein
LTSLEAGGGASLPEEEDATARAADPAMNSRLEIMSQSAQCYFERRSCSTANRQEISNTGVRL